MTKKNLNVQLKYLFKNLKVYSIWGEGDIALDWQRQFLFKLRSGPHVFNPQFHSLYLS